MTSQAKNPIRLEIGDIVRPAPSLCDFFPVYREAVGMVVRDHGIARDGTLRFEQCEVLLTMPSKEVPFLETFFRSDLIRTLTTTKP